MCTLDVWWMLEESWEGKRRDREDGTHRISIHLNRFIHIVWPVRVTTRRPILHWRLLTGETLIASGKKCQSISLHEFYWLHWIRTFAIITTRYWYWKFTMSVYSVLLITLCSTDCPLSCGKFWFWSIKIHSFIHFANHFWYWKRSGHKRIVFIKRLSYEYSKSIICFLHVHDININLKKLGRFSSH